MRSLGSSRVMRSRFSYPLCITPESLLSSGCDLKGICRRANNPSERIFQSSRLGILELNDLQDSLVMQPRSLEHCTVKALCILKPGNYNGCNLWACRGLVNKIGATMQHLFHNVIAAAFHLSRPFNLRLDF